MGGGNTRLFLGHSRVHYASAALQARLTTAAVTVTAKGVSYGWL